MVKEYIKLIEQTDGVLTTLRGFWLDAKSLDEKAKWMKRLNESLDERFRLMRCRDALTA